ncbi:TerC family protein, partial [Nocardiopsis mangrovi]
TANAFALMGLRQLYFLIGGLIDKLVYLSHGLAVILGFIGVKLILHAVHETTTLPVPEIPTTLSLVVIVATLVITTIASLYKTRHIAPKKMGGTAEAAPAAPDGGDAGEAPGHVRRGDDDLDERVKL